jgi:hypothetical protein
MYIVYHFTEIIQLYRDCRGRMVVEFTITYAVCAYHHYSSEFESRLARGGKGRWFPPKLITTHIV